ncbi:pyrroloquinoline quinone biosynthesis peptide chaperone PqqD [Actinokineospora globicatena]|uniref:Coenzyme PQQ synthesis protein D n=1 Tax=Actinokineospora globicatena TaxID=103729 RepID=A0A9W6QKC3_9PSEU|nr:pyrroloquinoline quinone biosynthesis peptide chaperone PqqD [Actinokineospora globicatena]MCP2303676.1 pyrroloquinoline quinone biosynthesis protein D [Actinokineospora globicatena]GLW79186.1 coenzyme PQQ synthesis protein D [Actinokineospora globicatena]GLW86404.1 coenzyme PQQ synthesis protein D [Actinokineospora globicatena]GLW89773.1 coenzyme PQQ synthesis protein D [Actinokineospora globicatena]
MSEWAPRLRRGARLGFDPVRRTPVVLYPEGVVVLNGTARAVLGACDGVATVPDIVAAMTARYRGVRPDDVLSLLRGLVARGVLHPEEAG